MMTRSKCPTPNRRWPSSRFVDQAHHGRIGRDEDPPFVVLLGHEVDRRRVGQVLLEGVDGLIHQSDAVGEEQHALRPVAAHQQIAQRDDRARLARAGRHDDQRLALVVALKRFADPADRARLVVPLDDRAR